MLPLVVGGIALGLWYFSRGKVLPIRNANEPRVIPSATIPSPGGAVVGVQALNIAKAAPLAFVPFQYTNRATGPVLGPVGALVSSAPSQMSQDIGTARTALGYAHTAAGVASAASSVIASAISGIGTIIGGVVGVLGFVQAGTMDPKTGLGEAQQESLELSSGVAVATTAVSVAAGAAAAAAGVAASAIVGLATLILLPITAFFTASAINDADNVKRAAEKEVRDYTRASRSIKDDAPFVASLSDRLDEVHALSRLNMESRLTWCRTQWYNAVDALNRYTVLVWAFTHFENGENLVGIPGRDVSILRGLVETGKNDAFLLMLFCQDYIVGVGGSLPVPPGTPLIQATADVPPIGLNPAYAPLTGYFAGEAGFAPADAFPGIVPGAIVTAHAPYEERIPPSSDVLQVMQETGATEEYAGMILAERQQAFTSGGM